jgi:hypothetical protein
VAYRYKSSSRFIVSCASDTKPQPWALYGWPLSRLSPQNCWI